MAEKEVEIAKTLGQAIDEIVCALQPLDQGSRVTAIRASCEHLNIPLAERSKGEQASGGAQEPGGSFIPTPLDIKNLKEQKKPSSANEMAAVAAYYLAEHAPEHDRKKEVDVEDMIKHFNQARFPLPKRPEFLLTNAKNAGYFDPVGNGKFKLNPVGYNLVAYNLPRSKSESPSRTTKARKRSGKAKQRSRSK